MCFDHDSCTPDLQEGLSLRDTPHWCLRQFLGFGFWGCDIVTLFRLQVSVVLATVVLVECGQSDDLAVPELVSGSIKTLYVEYSETFSGFDQDWSRSCVFARDGRKWHFSTRPIVGEG